MLAFWVLILFATAANSQDNCPRMCGNVFVPYPFGINHTSATTVNPSCAMNTSFLFLCNSTFNPPRLFFAPNMPIHNISIEEGTISVRFDSSASCYNSSGLVRNFSLSFGLGPGPFRLSDTRNKLTAIGCDTLALMQDAQQTFVSGCISLCHQNVTLQGSCSGLGCCQISVPRSLKTLTIALGSSNNHSEVWRFNPCDFAFIADERTFNVSAWQLWTRPFDRITRQFVKSDVVIEWVAKEKTCEEARSSSSLVCGSNTNCSYSENGQGYRCVCKNGFSGNPYLPQGCQDIDECREPDKYPCHGSCKNTIGDYTCKCPIGMQGDGKIGCQGFHVTSIVAVVGAVLLTLNIIVLIVILYKRHLKERNFFQKRSMLLKNQRVRSLSEEELVKVTKNND